MNTRFQQPQQAYLEFVRSMKLTAVPGASRALQDAYSDQAEAYAERNDGKGPGSVEEIDELMQPLPLYRWQQFLSRQSQEMMWQSIESGLAPDAEMLQQAMAQPNKAGALGRLDIPEDFEIPAWFTAQDIHIQPGGYHSNPMAGPIYDWGGYMYRPGVNDQAQEQQMVAEFAKRDNYTRILDMGCGTGKSTMPYKRLYPKAEVWGIDLGEPLLRFAHYKAENEGLAINYALMDTAAMRFEDNYFDRISSNIMFHEMPVETIRGTLREAYRVLRPGGQLVISDIVPFHSQPLYRQWVARWQDDNNGEPYWTPFLALRMADEMAAAGFKDAREVGSIRKDRPGGIPYVYTATK